MKQIKNKQKDFRRSLKVLFDSTIQIGAVGGHENTELNNNDLLAVHEFTEYSGGVRAPISKTINDSETQSKLKGTIKNLIAFNYDEDAGKFNAEPILNGIGLLLKNRIKKTILDGVSPDIEEQTKIDSAPRRADVPLIATGQMFDSIEFGVSLA